MSQLERFIFQIMLNIENFWFREFSSKEDAIIWGNSFYPSDVCKSTSDALKMYCGYLHAPINQDFRSRLNLAPHRAKISASIFEYACSHPVPENVVAFRFITEDAFLKMQAGRKRFFPFASPCLFEPGFMSTSLCLSELRKSNYILEHKELSFLLKIYVPKGFLGIYVAEIVSRGQEQELLLMPGCKLRVLKQDSLYCECLLERQDRVLRI